MSTKELLAHLGPDKEKVDLAMQEDLNNIHSSLLAEVISHGIFNGGKRVRPLLTILAACLCRYGIMSHKPTDDLFRLAMVFEYLHAASLLHDDVIDHADQRRGKASANAIWGNTPVILAGDFLHTRAMLLAGSIGGKRCLEIIAAATSAMVEAEFLQLQNSENRNLSEEDYFAVLQGKTAALIRAACECGAVFADAASDEVEALRLYGTNLGLAFQIVDDLLDYLGDPAKTGKVVGNDFLEGKMTLPLIHTIRSVSETDKNNILSMLAASKEEKKAAVSTIIGMIERADGFIYAKQRAEKLIANALEALQIFPHSKEKETLTVLANYVLTRQR